MAIIWHGIAQYERIIGVGNTWMRKAGVEDDSWSNRYIYSLYWSVTTMITVGYGDITPINVIEYMFATINMILISTVFAYNLNSIGIILSDIAKISK